MLAIRGEQYFNGLAVSGGIAHGRLLVLGRPERKVERQLIDPSAVAAELKRLNEALTATRQHLKGVRDRVAAAMGQSEAGIFEAHLLVLEDAVLLGEVQKLIRDQHQDAAFAFYTVTEKFATALSLADDDYLRERAADLRDIAQRVIDQLRGVSGEDALANLPEPCIVVAHDLSPSTTAQLNPRRVLAFATDLGGRTGHTAIMARKLGIPAVVGLGDASRHLHSGEYVLVDGYSGLVVVAPTDQTLFAYGQLKERHVALDEKLAEIRDQPAVTLDGQGIHLAANIESPADLPSVRSAGAAGVGLFRTEFLFLNRTTLPTEEEQYIAYRAVAEGCAPYPVVIRTLDLGGDKMPFGATMEREPNPFLGWRAIRISLTRPELLRTQIRAILRASAHGVVKILYPMISCVQEVQSANALLEECKGELRREGRAFDEHLEVGVMIEIPGAALIADHLAQWCDFFSIGTNDLTGYTLAVDRLNERVAHLYTPTHPAILKLIALTVAAGRRHNCWVGVCGEMAGEPAMIPLLVGLGVTELSATPRVLPHVKSLIRRLKLSEAQALVKSVESMEHAGDIAAAADRVARASAPELLEGRTGPAEA